MAITFVASATSVDVATIVVPATAAIGDLAVLFDQATNGSGLPTEVVPTGFTQWSTSQTTGALNRGVISYKVLVSGEPGSTITGMKGTAGSPNTNKVMFVFRSDTSSITAVTPSTLNSQGTGSDPTLQTVSAASGAAPLIVLGQAWCSNTTSAFSTESPAFDGTVTTSLADLIAGYKIYNSSPADHSIDMADLGSNNTLRSGYLQVTESSTVLTPGSGNLALSAATPERAVDDNRGTTGGNLALSTTAPTADINVHVTFTPTSANLVFSGTAPFIGSELTPGAGNLALSGTAPTVDAPKDRSPASANLVLSTAAPALDTAPNLSPSPGNLVLSPTAPDRTVATHTFLNPAGANLVLSGTAPSQFQDTIYLPALANLTLTTIKPGMVILEDHSIGPPSTDLTISKMPPTLSILRSRRTTTATSTMTSRLR